jgi:hypothetical protein
VLVQTNTARGVAPVSVLQDAAWPLLILAAKAGGVSFTIQLGLVVLRREPVRIIILQLTLA